MIVDVPFSIAGVATTIIITSRFTGKILLVDVGDGAVRDLLTKGNLEFVNEIDLIAITHGHFDHMGGLWSLLGFIRMIGRTRPLNILIPNGCIEVENIIKGFKESYSETIPFQICTFKLQHGSGFDTDFFKLKSMGVEHYGMENPSEKDILMPALGFQITIGQTTVSYTGDSRMCTSLEMLVDNVDLAIIEATYDTHPNPEQKVHLTMMEAKELATKAKSSLIVHRKPEIAKDILTR